MRAALIVAALTVASVVAAAPGGARAEGFDMGELYRRTEALVGALLHPPHPGGGEVILPPPGIDPKMALAPRAGGRLRVIRPPVRPEQR